MTTLDTVEKEKVKLEDRIVVWFFPAAFLILFPIMILNLIREKQFQPFLESYLQQYTEFGDETALFESLPEPVQAIIVTPKLDDNQEFEKYILSTLTWRIPARIRAGNPKEVNVIILVIETNVTVGTYSGGQPAYRKMMEVIMIDARNNAAFIENTFVGGNPPSSKAGSGPGYGSSPKGSAMKWIRTVLDAH